MFIMAAGCRPNVEFISCLFDWVDPIGKSKGEGRIYIT
jgi:hypothetical protein